MLYQSCASAHGYLPQAVYEVQRNAKKQHCDSLVGRGQQRRLAGEGDQFLARLEHGIRAVEEKGPFIIHAQAEMLAAMDDLLQRFVTQRRMKLQGEYTPCYALAG